MCIASVEEPCREEEPQGAVSFAVISQDVYPLDATRSSGKIERTSLSCVQHAVVGARRMVASRKDQIASGRAEGRPIRVLVIDDHPAILQAVQSAVSGREDIEYCGGADSAREGLRMVEQQHPDVVVADVALGDAHGLEVVEHIRERYPDTQVVVFSIYDEELYAERAIRMGALSYLMKSEPTSSLIKAIRRAHRGEVYLSRRMASRILGKIVRQQRNQVGASVDDLTERERDVFELLGEGHNMQEIVKRLNLNRKTVETYRRRAREKLGFNTTEELLQYAVQWTHRKAHTSDLLGRGSSEEEE